MMDLSTSSSSSGGSSSKKPSNIVDMNDVTPARSRNQVGRSVMDQPPVPSGTLIDSIPSDNKQATLTTNQVCSSLFYPRIIYTQHLSIIHEFPPPPHVLIKANDTDCGSHRSYWQSRNQNNHSAQTMRLLYKLKSL